MGITLIEICNNLLLCSNFNSNDALTYLLFFMFESCEFIVFYIILLQVARNMSRFL